MKGFGSPDVGLGACVSFIAAGASLEAEWGVQQLPALQSSASGRRCSLCHSSSPLHSSLLSFLPSFLIGIVTVPGLLPTGSKLIDTPGVPHPYQMAPQLTAEEVS